jgi:hypothetical protein
VLVVASKVRLWPITSFHVAHQPRRFGREADIGFGRSHDRILGAPSTGDHPYFLNMPIWRPPGFMIGKRLGEGFGEAGRFTY